MRLAVFSHKLCWASAASPTGFATDGGFPFQMRALSELFDATTLVIPYGGGGGRAGEMALEGHNISVVPLADPSGRGLRRKLVLPFWLARHLPTLLREALKADAVHAPIPGDIGTFGMLLAVLLRKPLFVRHGGNWSVKRTPAEGFWRWFMEKAAGGRNVMLATGGDPAPPSAHNPNVRWIFSTTLTAEELRACAHERGPVEPGRARLIIVCRQESGKGTELVIESLPLLMGEFPGVTLDVVGDGGALESLKGLAAAKGLAGRVTFHGRLEHGGVLELLRRADLFCYPTASEGFPKAVLEALACGLPVVTTRVSVLPHLLARGGGVLLGERTPAEMARAVGECLRSAEAYREMSARACETARQFTLERWQEAVGLHLREAWGELRKG